LRDSTGVLTETPNRSAPTKSFLLWVIIIAPHCTATSRICSSSGSGGAPREAGWKPRTGTCPSCNTTSLDPAGAVLAPQAAPKPRQVSARQRRKPSRSTVGQAIHLSSPSFRAAEPGELRSLTGETACPAPMPHRRSTGFSCILVGRPAHS
jgi:hypothetical protein